MDCIIYIIIINTIKYKNELGECNFFSIQLKKKKNVIFFFNISFLVLVFFTVFFFLTKVNFDYINRRDFWAQLGGNIRPYRGLCVHHI